MSDTTALPIEEQLARYGDAVEAFHAPSPAGHHRQNGEVSGPIAIDSGARRDDESGRQSPSRRGRLLLVAAVVLVLTVSAFIVVGLLDRSDRLVTDDVDIPTTTAPERSATSSTQANPAPSDVDDVDGDGEALLDPDVDVIPDAMRVLSPDVEWLPTSARWVSLPPSDSGEPDVGRSDAVVFHDAEAELLHIWIVEIDSDHVDGLPGSIDGATPWGDSLHGGLSWAGNDDRFLFQTLALGERPAPTGSNLKDVARAVTSTDDGWELAGTSPIMAGVFRDGRPPDELEPGYAEIRWAPVADGRPVLADVVNQQIEEGGIGDLISILHEVASSGTVRMVLAVDGTTRFIVDSGSFGYALAVVGANVITWQGPSGESFDRLVTGAELVDDDTWSEIWADSTKRLVRLLTEQEAEAKPIPRLVPGEDWTPVDASDPSLWPIGDRIEFETTFSSTAAQPTWIGGFVVDAETSKLPDVLVTVNRDVSPAPFLICDDPSVSTRLGLEACGGNGRSTGSRMIVRGDGWGAVVISPVLTIDELVTFSDELEARRSDAWSGFNHADSSYTLVVDSDDVSFDVDGYRATWRRDDLDIAVQVDGIHRGFFLQSRIFGVLNGRSELRDNGRHWFEDGTRSGVTWYDEGGRYSVAVTWDPRDTSASDEVMEAVVGEVAANLVEVDDQQWRRLVEPVNRPPLSPEDIFTEYSED